MAVSLIIKIIYFSVHLITLINSEEEFASSEENLICTHTQKKKSKFKYGMMWSMDRHSDYNGAFIEHCVVRDI